MSKRNEAARERLAQIAREKGYKKEPESTPKPDPQDEALELGRVIDKNNKECREAIKQNRLEEAFVLGNKALEGLKQMTSKGLIKKTDSSKTWFEVYYRLGLTKADKDCTEALKYFKLAQEYDPKNEDVIFIQWYCNFNADHFAESIVAASQLNTPLAKVLITRSELALRKIDPQSARQRVQTKQIKDSLKTDQQKKYYFETMAAIEESVGNYTEAISCLKKVQGLTEPQLLPALSGLVSKAIFLYYQQGDYKGGVAYLKETYAKYPKLKDLGNTPGRDCCEFLLYNLTGNKAEEAILLEKIDRLAKDSTGYKIRADFVNKCLFLDEMLKGFINAQADYKAARAHFEKISSVTPYDLLLLDFAIRSGGKIFIKDLFEDKELAIALIEARSGGDITALKQELDEILAKLDNRVVVLEEEQKPQEQGVQMLTMEGSEPPAIEPWRPEAVWNPKAIHEYFRRKKALLEKQAFDELSGVKHAKEASWLLPDGQKIGLKNVYKVANSENFYVYIKEGICASEQLDAFINAITIKGMVHRKEEQNGIKYCSGNGLAEVKINGDARMWTDLTLRNEDGKYLLVMKHSGNHAAFARVAQNSKMTVQKVDTCAQYDAGFEQYSESKRPPDLECKKATDLDKYPDEEGVVTITGKVGELGDAFYDEVL